MATSGLLRYRRDYSSWTGPPMALVVSDRGHPRRCWTNHPNPWGRTLLGPELASPESGPACSSQMRTAKRKFESTLAGQRRLEPTPRFVMVPAGAEHQTVVLARPDGHFRQDGTTPVHGLVVRLRGVEEPNDKEKANRRRQQGPRVAAHGRARDDTAAGEAAAAGLQPWWAGRVLTTRPVVEIVRSRAVSGAT